MSHRRQLRKLVDIHESAVRLQLALERFLQAHSIHFTKVEREGVFRYRVAPEDLCCAQAVLPALQQIAHGGSDAE